VTLPKTKKESIQTTMYLPNPIHYELRMRAAKEQTTMNWIICEALMQYLGMLPEDMPGKRPAKTKTERKSQWEDKSQEKRLNYADIPKIIERLHKQGYRGGRMVLEFQSELDKYDLPEEEIEEITEKYYDEMTVTPHN